MPSFAERYRAAHIELRGHGRTNDPAGMIRYEMIAADVVRFIEVLQLGTAHIAGVSDGGIVALAVDMTGRTRRGHRWLSAQPFQRRASRDRGNEFCDLEVLARERRHGDGRCRQETWRESRTRRH